MAHLMQKPFGLSAKAVIRDRRGRCLLLRRSRDSTYDPGKWDLPGGKVDPGESFEQALRREVNEETGLTISLDAVAGAAESEVADVRVAHIIMEGSTASTEVRLSSEHDDFQWVDCSEIGSIDICDHFRPFFEVYCGSVQA